MVLFCKVFNLFDQLCNAVGTQSFYHALWKVLLTCPGVRIPAMNFLMARLPSHDARGKKAKIIQVPCLLSHFQTSTDFDACIPEKSTLVLGALLSAMADPSILILRVVFDLLLQHFPIDKRWAAVILILHHSGHSRFSQISLLFFLWLTTIY